MAELVGLAASIIQIAGAGAKLSTALYSYVDSAVPADQEVAEIAGDVDITANALNSVGQVFENEDAHSVVSKRAIQDAANLIKRCEAVFAQVYQVLDRRRTTKDGKRRSPGAFGKMTWGLKEQRMELLRRRLGSLKTSLILLLHVLQLANGRAKGNLEGSALQEGREKIRELHQRHQDSLKSLQALESKLSHLGLDDDDETLRGSSTPSHIATVDFMARPALPSHSVSAEWRDPFHLKATDDRATATDDSESSDSGGTMTDEEGEHLTLDELSSCARHVQRLLKRISVLQDSFQSGPVMHSNQRYPRHQVRKLYRRFCQRFESDLVPSRSEDTPESLPLPEFAPPSRNPDAISMTTHPQNEVAEASPDPSEMSRPGEASRASRKSSLTVSDQDSPFLQEKLERSTANLDASQHGSSQTMIKPTSPKDVPLQYTKTGRISKAKKGLKVHTCECGRSYTRAEHLRRHQKNHEQTAFTCNYDQCGKTFFRLDLLQRHQERHQERLANNLPDLSPRPSVTSQGTSHSPDGSGLHSANKPPNSWAIAQPTYAYAEPTASPPTGGSLGKPRPTGPVLAPAHHSNHHRVAPNQRPLLPSIGALTGGLGTGLQQETGHGSDGYDYQRRMALSANNRPGSSGQVDSGKQQSAVSSSIRHDILDPSSSKTTNQQAGRDALRPTSSGTGEQVGIRDDETAAPGDAAHSCVQCKSRNVKCDGGVQCSRCRAEGVECMYIKSFLNWGREARSEETQHEPEETRAGCKGQPTRTIGNPGLAYVEEFRHDAVGVPRSTHAYRSSDGYGRDYIGTQGDSGAKAQQDSSPANIPRVEPTLEASTEDQARVVNKRGRPRLQTPSYPPLRPSPSARGTSSKRRKTSVGAPSISPVPGSSSKEGAQTGATMEDADKDIVDVLLDEWTVPVY